ncbi:hypothetical protein [Catenulispora pinisilvae]|uniref:hypothetical protein n=1 Tax=Catenulispora pinisilvae TaxID=2705253 RepID=UPI0018928159|nr:hypothetical protein [Catenulispora pinisilvae]
MNSLRSVVVEILGRPHILGQSRALAARMIAADEEINHILARTKGTLARPIWAGCARESDRCMDLFITEWGLFKARVGDDSELRRSPNPCEVGVFQEAVAGTEWALGRLRQEFGLLGMTSWVYDDEEP